LFVSWKSSASGAADIEEFIGDDNERPSLRPWRAREKLMARRQGRLHRAQL
jgi:hypothetical protein